MIAVGDPMLDLESVDYFRRREFAERAAAKRALTNEARRAHQEMAQSYSDLLRGVSSLSEARG